MLQIRETNSASFPFAEVSRQREQCDSLLEMNEMRYQSLKSLQKSTLKQQMQHLNFNGVAPKKEKIRRYRDWIVHQDTSHCYGPHSRYVALISKDGKEFMLDRQMSYLSGSIASSMYMKRNKPLEKKARLRIPLS